MATYKWLGFDFYVEQYRANWNDLPGIYVFALPMLHGWAALYVGKTESFRDRIHNHPRWPEAVRLGCTHVHARVETLAANRDMFERNLIFALQPRMNAYLR